MKVGFKFEDEKSQIILTPTSAIDEANLATMRQFGDKYVKFKLGAGKEFIIESNGGPAPGPATQARIPAAKESE